MERPPASGERVLPFSAAHAMMAGKGGMNMNITYIPRGVCSRRFDIQVEDGVIRSLEVVGGCNGNLQGISRLVIGMPAREAIERMKGIRCGGKPSSCPDQLSIALEQALAKGE